MSCSNHYERCNVVSRWMLLVKCLITVFFQMLTAFYILPYTNLQIDTKDILFICGGAFVGLEKTISERYFCQTQLNSWITFRLSDILWSSYHSITPRRQDSSIGFGAPVRTNMRVGGLTDAVVTSSLLESVRRSLWLLSVVSFSESNDCLTLYSREIFEAKCIGSICLTLLSVSR